MRKISGSALAKRIQKLTEAIEGIKKPEKPVPKFIDKAKRAPRRSALKKRMHTAVEGSMDDPCVYCGAKADTADHIVPRSVGGGNEVENLAPCCKRCNMEKSSASVLMFLLSRSKS